MGKHVRRVANMDNEQRKCYNKKKKDKIKRAKERDRLKWMMSQQNIIPPLNPDSQRQLSRQNNMMPQQMSPQIRHVSLQHRNLEPMNQQMGHSPNQPGPSHQLIVDPRHHEPSYHMMNHSMCSHQNITSHHPNNINILAPAQRQSTMAMVQPQTIIVPPLNLQVEKKNYWQKSTDSSEISLIESAEVSKNRMPPEKDIVNPLVPVSDKNVETTEQPKENSTQDSRKYKVKPKPFNVSTLGALVTSCVEHNNSMRKTDCLNMSKGSVVVTMNKGLRKYLPSAPENRQWSSHKPKGLSTGQQIQCTLEKTPFSSLAPHTISESSSKTKSTKEDLPVRESWYDENDEESINYFDVTI